MRKILFCMLTVIAVGMLTSCNGCGSKSAESADVTPTAANDYDGVVQDFTAGVDHIIALHKQTMFNLANGQEFQWRNLQVAFNDSIKAETLDCLHITDITDVFFYWSEGSWVQYISTNVKKGTIIPDRIRDVWIEDSDMSEVEIRLMPEDVLNRLKEWNGVIPSSWGMVLRLPVGPRNCNAQWVVGNARSPLFIDAVTGEITEWNPAFPIPNVNGPLGEWP